MAYDIPPPLQHHEKIIFGLTFAQLLYAVPAFFVVFFVFFKLDLSLEVSFVISFLVFCLSLFFMFFDGLSLLRHWINFLRNPSLEVLSEKLKGIVDICKIEKSVVCLSKSRVAVLEVFPMNFMLKDDLEKDSIVVGFQKFLNSLDFSIQFHVSSTFVDLKDHFSFARKQVKNRNFLSGLVESYISFVEKNLSENSVRNRRFYVVIRERDDLELQCRVCLEKLQSLGLKVHRLNDSALIKYFLSYIATNREKSSNVEEVKDLAHFFYAPERIKFFSEYFIVDDVFCKVVSVVGYPHSVEMGFLDQIVSSADEYDVSVHVEPFPISETMVSLNRDLQKQRADLFADTKKGILNPSLEIKYNSTRKVLEDLQKGKQKLFNVSLYVMCKCSRNEVIKRLKTTDSTIIDAECKQVIDLMARRVKANFDSLMIQSSVPSFQMMESYASMLPLANNRLGIKRNIHTEGLATFFPFSSPFLDVQPEGVLLGLNKNKIPYIKNVFSLANANGIILATSGSGKSYFTKLLLSRQYMNGCDIIVIDPQGEYLAITEHYNGQNITISKNSETIINPLDLMGHEYLEKRLSLIDLFNIMFGDINELQKSILDRAIDLTYETKGITRDNYEGSVPPRLSDLFEMLSRMERSAVQQEKVTYRALLNRLQMYTERGVFGFLDRHTNIDFSKDFVCFNIGSMPKQVKPVVMYLILDYVYMKMKDSNRRKLLVIDEAWSLLQTAEQSSYIFEIIKTCRKFNLGLLMITQDVADLVGSKAGHAVLANTAYTFLLRQKPVVMKNVAKTFNLSPAESNFLVTAKLGAGILLLENEHQELEVIASPEEHKLITTNPDEMIKLNEAKKGKNVIINKEVEDAGIDFNKLYYPANELNVLQKNVLANHNYVLKKGHSLDSGPHFFYVKPNPPESAEHTLLVGLIVEELKKHTKEVKSYQTKMPDIIFKNKLSQEIVLEIETGKNIKKHKTRINEKFENISKKYRERAYLILTQNNLKHSYAKHGLTMLLRKDIKKFVQLQFSGKKNSNIGRELNRTKIEIRQDEA